MIKQSSWKLLELTNIDFLRLHIVFKNCKLYSKIFFPALILHEFSHWIILKIFNISTTIKISKDQIAYNSQLIDPNILQFMIMMLVSIAPALIYLLLLIISLNWLWYIKLYIVFSVFLMMPSNQDIKMTILCCKEIKNLLIY